MYTPTYYRNASAAQILAGLHNEVKRLKGKEHLLEQQILYYKSSLEEVRTVLYANINKANEMQNFLAPISRLPNEMLLAIFEEVVACQDPLAEGRAEITISKVSRRWRDLAIHAPRLWRHVSITPRVAPSMLEMYKTRASRALDIEIWGWKDRRDFQRFDAALEMILDSAGRWRSLLIAGVCDSHLSHLTLKLSHVGHFSGLKHFTFRAFRPGQTCPVSFLMEGATQAQAHGANQTLSPCTLKSLDAENFTLTGDLGGINARAVQNLSRLSSLTLRRYSNNDARSLRIMIDFSAFRAMLSAIPNLTTLVLHGQPLRFRTGTVGGLQSTGNMHGGGIGLAANLSAITLPHLHTLVLHPGVLKPRYLQHTISAIHAPVLRHFELVFPDSKISGQNVVERLFLDAQPLTPFASSSSSSTFTPYTSSSSMTHEHLRRRRPRFPRVETLVLNNASSAATALAFIHAFPNTTQLNLGGVDVGSFSLVLRANAGPSISAVPGVKQVTEPLQSGTMCGLGMARCDDTYTRYACWHRLDTITVRHPRQEALRVLLDWVQHASERGLNGAPSMLVVQASSLDRPDIRYFARCARAYARVELVAIQDFGGGTV